MAHYYFRDNFYCDNGMIPFLLVLEHLSTQDKPFSEIMAPVHGRSLHVGRTQLSSQRHQSGDQQGSGKISRQGQEDFTDGYSLETPEWRFNIRGSNTEPLLRLNIEARKPELVDKIRNEIEEIIEMHSDPRLNLLILV